ncbi:elongation factor-like GTPase 1 [Anabrus simplex]|uniref:elongation factor-like GTPase 1 n=1 Tax=Anabrus simplex TaxID=316456 RepID=UPI0035A3563F
MRLLNAQKLGELQRNPNYIRNICILAHVDHGKTTLADSLVASNGIISPKMAGKLRYMDSRKDEQERGITMKSSSIALLYTQEEKEYLVNLIDSPGHVDFSSEVSTAVRLCDGAIVIVDVVEGVCPQTKVALKQAWMENIRPVLVLNKIDRFILEMKLSPLDAYVHLTQLLEQINAVMGELFATEVLGRGVPGKPSAGGEGNLYDWSTGLEDADDSHLYFTPELGNVIFASAVDGWGFGIQDFARIFAKKLGVQEKVLQKCLWGDYYLQSKTMRVMPGAQEKAKKPLFVQFVLENLWAVYETIVIRKDKEKLQKILTSLNIQLSTRDMRHTDSKVQLQAACSQWLPLATAVLDMVCKKLPCPAEISEEKAEKLMCSHTQRFDSFPSETQALKPAFLTCSSAESAPLIVFISKMFPVERKMLPENRLKPLSAEEIAQRREQARLRHTERLMQSVSLDQTGNGIPDTSETVIEEEPSKQLDPNEDVFIAFARVFSGTIRNGQEVYVLGPKHDPGKALDKLKNGEEIDPNVKLKDLKPGQHVTRVKIEQLYLMMGRELEAIDEVPAGNVLGIGGLEEHVLKSATLSTTVACPAFTELQLMAVPILRVAVEPAQPQDLPALVRGLKLLNQADACVQVLVQETGEHVLVTAGEVHLERCLSDLKERYAKVSINASEPIVPFRETVVKPPVVDMVNEVIQEQTNAPKKDGEVDSSSGMITISTSNKQSTIKIRAAPLPEEVTALLENNAELLKAWDRHLSAQQTAKEQCVDIKTDIMTERSLKSVRNLQKQLKEAFSSAGKEWEDAVDHIWSVGPRHCGPNVLLNRTTDYIRPSMWEVGAGVKSDPRSEYDSSFISGFQLATLAGPLCEEPMMGVCFVVEEWSIASQPDSSEETGSSQPFGPFSGQIMSTVKDACRRAFQAQPQRLMAAMYSCSIQVNADMLVPNDKIVVKLHRTVVVCQP